MYKNLTNAEARKLPKELQKRCIKLTDGTWDIKTTYLPENLKGLPENVKDKPTSKDSSKEKGSFSPDKKGNSLREEENKIMRSKGGAQGTKRNMGKQPKYKDKRVMPAKKLGFF